MKNIKTFPTRKLYEEFIFDQIVTNDEFKNNKFYFNLIQFIIDHRSPVFYEASSAVEYAHFTQYFNFALMREYENSYLSDLYYIHDFIHMLFENPQQPKKYSLSQFHNLVVKNERISANDTEILTYKRLPSLRNKTLTFPILYDLLPKDLLNTRSLYNLRNQIIETENVPEYLNNKDGLQIVAFLKRFKSNNNTWSKLWYENFSSPHQSSDFLTLKNYSYEQFLLNYKTQKSQKSFEQNTLKNFQTAALINNKMLPISFKETFNLANYLNENILLEDTARIYHKLYTGEKTTWSDKLTEGNNELVLS